MNELFTDILFLLLQSETIKANIEIKFDERLEKAFERKCFQTLKRIYDIILIEQSDADCVDQVVEVFDELEETAGMPWRELALMKIRRDISFDN